MSQLCVSWRRPHAIRSLVAYVSFSSDKSFIFAARLRISLRAFLVCLCTSQQAVYIGAFLSSHSVWSRRYSVLFFSLLSLSLSSVIVSSRQCLFQYLPLRVPTHVCLWAHDASARYDGLPAPPAYYVLLIAYSNVMGSTVSL